MANILLIEDDEDIRLNVAEILTLAEHNIMIATNGTDGIAIAQKEHPDLIISDVTMPGIDGFGVLHILRKHPSIRHIPFIFLTSKSESADFRQAIKLGADDYIIKPFEGSDLLNAVDANLKKNRQDRSIEEDNEHSEVAAEKINDKHKTNDGKDPLLELIKSSETIEYKKKHIIYKEKSTPRFLYYIKSGKIKTFKRHEDGKDLVISLLGEGDFLSYAAILENSYQTETAEVIEDCELAMVPRKKFEQVLSDNAEVMKRIMNLLAKNLMEKEEQVLGLAYNTLRKKVAEALLSLEKKYHKKKDEKFTINLGRTELASIAGTATESLIRTLTEFKQEKLIEMHNGLITIIDKDRLEYLLR
ncbi:MAG: response regulator [Bacteroidetes bacterium]|nr:response regulator [Bacteroidota bacterium]